MNKNIIKTGVVLIVTLTLYVVFIKEFNFVNYVVLDTLAFIGFTFYVYLRFKMSSKDE